MLHWGVPNVSRMRMKSEIHRSNQLSPDISFTRQHFIGTVSWISNHLLLLCCIFVLHIRFLPPYAEVVFVFWPVSSWKSNINCDINSTSMSQLFQLEFCFRGVRHQVSLPGERCFCFPGQFWSDGETCALKACFTTSAICRHSTLPIHGLRCSKRKWFLPWVHVIRDTRACNAVVLACAACICYDAGSVSRGFRCDFHFACTELWRCPWEKPPSKWVYCHVE